MNVFTAALLFLPALVSAESFDLIVANARVVDGSGNPWYRGDIGIRDGHIAAIGDLRDASGRRLDASGQIVCPGFIDLMGVTSFPLLADPPSAVSKLVQGITTMVSGEGQSVAPQNEATMTPEMRKSPYRWRTFAEYFALVERHGLPMNVVHNVGAAQVRRVVVGDQNRQATPGEMQSMVAHVREAMRAGAVGVSSALIYPPGIFASREELIALAREAGRFGGFYSTHMRNESSRLLEAVNEALDIGASANVPVHIYHLKAAGRDNWPLMEQAIQKIAAARARGMDVTSDIYPYIRNGLTPESMIHPRHFANGAQQFLRSLAEPAVRAEVRREMEQTADWEN